MPGTGNLTLADFTAQYNLNLKQVLRSLSDQNIEAAAELTLRVIAEKNGIGPMDLFEMIKASVQGA